MRYLITGFNSETGEIYRGEEVDQAGAEHQAASWLETKPIGSHAQVLVVADDYYCPPGSVRSGLTLASKAKRVMGGVEWS